MTEKEIARITFLKNEDGGYRVYKKNSKGKLQYWAGNQIDNDGLAFHIMNCLANADRISFIKVIYKK